LTGLTDLRAAGGAIFMVLAAAPLFAQENGGSYEEKESKDPYTLDNPIAREAAGVVSYGPFDFGDNHGTKKVREVLGGIEIQWIETAHFKIGSTLDSYKIPSSDRKQRDKLRDELKQLSELLPAVKYKRIKTIDPWLRLHLYAQRLEKMYRELSELLQVDDSSFPMAPGLKVRGEYMGEGPFLGHRSKFGVLLLGKKSGVGRYLVRFCGKNNSLPQRFTFPGQDMMLFITSSEAAEGWLSDDTRLQTHVTFNVMHNLVDSYKHYNYALPVWIGEGIAHWYSRGIDPRFNNFSFVEETSAGLRKEWDWEPKVYKRVKNKIIPAASEIVNWSEFGNLKFTNHLAVWSLVDFLVEYDRNLLAEFIGRINGKIPGVPITRIPTTEEVLDRQEEVFREVYGWTWDELDVAWHKWVLKNYPKK